MRFSWAPRRSGEADSVQRKGYTAFFGSSSEWEDGHAYGEALGDLLNDDAVLATADFAFHLQTPVDGRGRMMTSPR